MNDEEFNAILNLAGYRVTRHGETIHVHKMGDGYDNLMWAFDGPAPVVQQLTFMKMAIEKERDEMYDRAIRDIVN